MTCYCTSCVIRERHPSGHSIGGHLLAINEPSGESLSDDLLLPEVATMFLAGFETSGHTLAWTLWV